ncbi:MAG: right-handed parallel beta-helix repeat-containing protein, partial [Planctomycetes bacterium]|nr:right-handed parallel beta-helix repeat-containing protein [Planctomycetota bacterium]
MKTLGTIVLALTLALGGTAAADVTYYLDAVHGNDTLGNGSAGAPWQSRDRVLAVVTGGDTVVLASGNYGTFALTATAAGGWDLFDDWVTFIEAPGANARFELIRISYTGTPPPDPYQVGFFDAYLRFEGIHVLDGVECFGARHWALIDCLVERYGPWTGAFENTRKMAVYFRSGTDILIKGCEITRTGTAVEGRGHDIRVLNCHIHHGTHDGIRAKGWWHSLIEGNLIHSFDDGVTDEEADWSSHCDLIHLYIPLPGIEGMQNRDVIIRNNVLYDTENQIVVLMGCFESDLRNQDIVFENNILGPSRATLFNNLDPCDGLVIRNNTVVVFDQPRPFGRWELENYTLRINEDSTGVQIYNNILGTCMIKTGAELLVFDHNLIQVPPDDNPAGVDNTRTFARNTLVGVDPMFVDPGAFDGVLDPASPAINFGTRRLAPTPIWEEDIVGTPRDWRPDLGAWELPGQIPLRESPPPIHYDVKTTFVDDFADGHYRDVDPWLDGPRQQGMNWDRPDPVNSKFCVTPSDCFDGSNALVGPQGDNVSTRQAWLFSEQGANWADYDFTFDAVNNYITRGSGVMVLAQDRDNY